ncbi:sensor histidine kinase [Curvibacter sp. HBC61]|uniref:histidine kinase n=1 Tax=Curvibacter cyanobacteriorum TaxID=3026422 RepID=A0ABT5MSV7_9BURK|nr:sensor histidine kinase [Curvibacter sp. HBC61]MDD0837134.1 sensor histidine kinase [Curvibacter sp. HBC61]
MNAPRRLSLRRYLLLGLLVPIGVYVLINSWTLYTDTQKAVQSAYDRTLLASAKSIGELLTVEGYDELARLQVRVPHAALEAFETDIQSRMYYRVSDVNGQWVSGFEALPAWPRQALPPSRYSALVHFYDDHYLDDRVRVAVLLQPVVSENGRGMAMVQVAETVGLRDTMVRDIMLASLLRQGVLVAVIIVIVTTVVQRATRPVRRISAELQQRQEGELNRISAPDAPRELLPLIDATNQLMVRLQSLLDHQKRFVRDTSHQLRTPLAVLKVQVQSALRGDVEPHTALLEINDTVERATQLANQMLALAKVEQLRQQSDAPQVDLAEVLRDVALDLSPLVAERSLDFELHASALTVPAHDWMLRELVRNLLHNAIRHSPPGGRLGIHLTTDAEHAVLTVSDQGPGLSPQQRERLFQPFWTGDVPGGTGLGLTICHDIVQALHGRITLKNREHGGRVQGLDACVRLPLQRLADAAAP